MGTEGRARRAVLLDALGTLLRLEPPAPRLRAALQARAGVDVGGEAAVAAIRAEIAFYRAHLHEGGDAAGLADLRRRAADAMRPALPPGAAGLPSDMLVPALLDALEFTPFCAVPPALAALRARGFALVVVSNWDVSLHERLAETGLRALVDGAVASAELGVAKPDPAIFHHALALVGAEPEGSWHVGDTPDVDVAGALAAGLRPVLVARDEVGASPDVPVVRDLGALAGLIRAGAS
jgi:putative hydrolase of the HAD superfamily